MGSEEVISAMQAATARLMIETRIQPHTMLTGPPLFHPIEKDAAVQTVVIKKGTPVESFVRHSVASRSSP
jgi:hypothetical protein